MALKMSKSLWGTKELPIVGHVIRAGLHSRSCQGTDVRCHGICPVLAPSIHLVCKPTQMHLGTFSPFCEIIIVSNLVMASDGSFLLHHSALAPKLTETVLHDFHPMIEWITFGIPTHAQRVWSKFQVSVPLQIRVSPQAHAL